MMMMKIVQKFSPTVGTQYFWLWLVLNICLIFHFVLF